MPVEIDGGYDTGYQAVHSFWGMEPGSLVSAYLSNHNVDGLRVLDAGAGEGKNAAAFAKGGAIVDAVECSSHAIKNGKQLFPHENIVWMHRDILDTHFPANSYDIVLSYGLTHCLGTEIEATRLIAELQSTLVPGGTFMLVSFNSGTHDLSAHPGFRPLLLDHSWFLERFDGWHLDHVADAVIFETHPHNNIPHHHSLTRISAIKP